MTLKTFDQPTDDTVGITRDNSSWEDLEIDLDDDKECKFFPSRTYQNVRNLAAGGVPILMTIQFATYLLGPTFGRAGVREQMQDLTCELLTLVAEIWNGGGTEECVEYEEVPGHKWICEDEPGDAVDDNPVSN